MVSTYGYIPIFDTEQHFQSNEISKEGLTSFIKDSVNKVQNASTIRNGGCEDPLLQPNIPEVWQLCESLDKALLHGLRQLPYGYWPFVKEFTHHNCKAHLNSLENVKTSLGRSRAWLCQALNESTLESYITSFLGNPKVLEKHYIQPALLRDTQRMQIVLTLMAGLEFIDFDMPADLSTWDTLGFANFVVKPELDSSELDTFSASTRSSSACLESKSSATPVSMRSLIDDDSTDCMSIESAFEATDENISINDCLPNCSCSECIFKATIIEQQQHISHLIGLDPDKISSDESSDTTLEVLHTRICKPRRKKLSNELSQESNDNNNDLNSNEENAGAMQNDNLERDDLSFDSEETGRLSGCDIIEKSGLLHSKGSSSSENEIGPIDNDSNNDYLSWLGERESPEGQEDPHCSINDLKSMAKEISTQDSEEFSIYDGGLNKISPLEETSNEIAKVEEKEVLKEDCSIKTNEWTSELSINSSSTSYQEQKDEYLQDRSYKIGNNILLYFSLEVFQQENEKLYKVFLASTMHSELELSFVVLTNSSLYILLKGNEKIGRFRVKTIIPYQIIDTIVVDLNYQSFLIQCHGGILKCNIITGSDFLTRSILSNLDVAMRRHGIKVLPSVETLPTAHIQRLTETLSKELMLKEDLVDLQYFALVQWENYMGVSPATSPGGPIQEGFLMYKHKQRGAVSWTPAYFHLKAGVLYCYKDSDSQSPDFYFQLHYPHFNGCRRCQISNRPHSFELKLRGKEKLILAAANDAETSMWLQSILQTVALFGRLTDTKIRSTKSCSLVLANESFFVFGDNSKNSSAILGKALLADLVAIRIDIESPTLCVLEFESGEANKCSGDWITIFGDVDEKEKFLSIITIAWEKLFQVSLSVSSLKDLSLWSRCREHYQQQKMGAENMIDLLKDDS